MEQQFITKTYFIKRLGDLCLRSGASGFPKDLKDQHILLKSTILLFGEKGSYSEQEINQKLEDWVRNISRIKDLDRVTLRRRLVDTGYLIRSADGSKYQVAQPGPKSEWFDPEIDQLDVAQVIENAREEIAHRKREYLQKAKGG